MWKYLNKGISTPLAIGIILILVIIVGGFALWQRAEMTREENKPLPEVQIPEKKEVKDETAGWQTYRNEEYGFEIKYPEDIILYPPFKIYPIEYNINDHKYSGIKFSEFNNGCILNIFKTDSSEEINPFDETNVSIKMKRYVASKKIETNDKIYYFGMAIISHAVAPEDCVFLFDQMLSTFKFIEEE